MSKLGIAPADPKSVKFNRCAKCTDKTPQSAGCMLPKCKGCPRSLRFHVAYCSTCSQSNGKCQLCGGSIADAAKSLQSTQAPAKPKGRGPLSLMPYIEEQAKEQDMDVDSFIGLYADGVTEGYGARDKKDERRLIRMGRETKLVAAEVTRIRTVMADGGYGEVTQSIAIGEFICAVREQAKAAKAAAKK
ncbi:MAG TPA: hypothetical protein V6C81_12135 [Planktothrix sp.]|jgi:hypothetical protein